jgi:hypothetical protein
MVLRNEADWGFLHVWDNQSMYIVTGLTGLSRHFVWKTPRRVGAVAEA